VKERLLALHDIEAVDETVEDAEAATMLLRQNPKVDPKAVYLLGYGFGGQLAPRIVARDPAMAGMIVLAGNLRRVADSVPEEMEYLASIDGPPTPEARTEITLAREQLTRIATLAKGDPPILGIASDDWVAWLQYDAVAVATLLPQPILILQGGNDYRVTRDDFELWRAKLTHRQAVTFKYYPSFDHLFVARAGKAHPSEYLPPGGHVSDQTLNDIVAWILNSGGHRRGSRRHE
jgi:dienelactone hydrolase